MYVGILITKKVCYGYVLKSIKKINHTYEVGLCLKIISHLISMHVAVIFKLTTMVS